MKRPVDGGEAYLDPSPPRPISGAWQHAVASIPVYGGRTFFGNGGVTMTWSGTVTFEAGWWTSPAQDQVARAFIRTMDTT
jgi:hypothetical protein